MVMNSINDFAPEIQKKINWFVNFLKGLRSYNAI